MSLSSPFLSDSEMERLPAVSEELQDPGYNDHAEMETLDDEELEAFDFEDFEGQYEASLSDLEDWEGDAALEDAWSPLEEHENAIDDGYPDSDGDSRVALTNQMGEEDAEVEDDEFLEAEAYQSELSLLETEGTGSIRFPSGASLRVVTGAEGSGQEHWDPNRTGNPLLDASSRSTKLATNFTVDELTRSGGRRFTVARIDPKLVECLQAVRDKVGRPVVITSGYRSWGHNKAVYDKRGKQPTKSRHCSGQAVDIRISDMDGTAIAKAAIDVCGTGIGVGIGSNYAHIDVRGSWTRWTYLSGSENRKTIQEIDRYARSRKQAPMASRGSPSSSSSTPSIDVKHAVIRNGLHSQRLGWGRHRAAIARHLGLADSPPDEGAFAKAVARWQSRHRLEVDGILGPSSWRTMQRVAGLEVGYPRAQMSTSQLRDKWEIYRCRGGGTWNDTIRVFDRNIGGVPSIASDAYRALERALHSSGYTPDRAWAYNCRGIGGSAPPWSLHAYGIAIDIDQKQNPFTRGDPFSGRLKKQHIDAVYAIRTTSGRRLWSWGGYWNTSRGRDRMHFQLDRPPNDVDVDWTTVPN